MKIQNQILILSLALISTGCKFLSPSDSMSIGGSFAIHSQKISLGWRHVCSLDKNGKIFCWGSNSHGQLGISRLSVGETSWAKVPTEVDDPDSSDEWVDLDLGRNSSCAQKQSGRIYCWGDNRFAQTGIVIPDDDPATQLVLVPTEILVADFTGFTVGDTDISDRYKSLFGSRVHHLTFDGEIGCAVRNDNEKFCWGLDRSFSPYISSTTTGRDGAVMEKSYERNYTKHFKCNAATPQSLCTQSEVTITTKTNYMFRAVFRPYVDPTIKITNMRVENQTRCETYFYNDKYFYWCQGFYYFPSKSTRDPEDLIFPIHNKTLELGQSDSDFRCLQMTQTADHGCVIFLLRQDGLTSYTSFQSDERGSIVGSVIENVIDPLENYAPTSISVGDSRYHCRQISKFEVMCTSTAQSVKSWLDVFDASEFSETYLMSVRWLSSDIEDAANIFSMSGEVLQVEAGDHFVCARLEGGKVSCAGENFKGQYQLPRLVVRDPY